MSQANQEQLKAIEHNGGVLLKAGAGSGKTFVLIEHVIYLVNQFLNNEKFLDELDQRQKVRKFLSEIVLMTFTKKAAGEILIRLREKVEHLVSVEGGGRWKIVSDSLEVMTITTIHGFCHKIIREGYVESLGETEMISDAEFHYKIENLFQQWVDGAIKTNKSASFKTLIKYRDQLVSSFKKIFMDPTLRLTWESMGPESLSQRETDDMISKWCEEILSGLDHPLDIGTLEEYKGKKWNDFLQSNYSALSNKITGYEDFKRRYDILAALDFKLPRKPLTKLGLVDVDIFFEALKSLNSMFKKNGEDIIAFHEMREQLTKEFLPQILSLFSHINDKYPKIGGLTFSDLEFYVHKELMNEECQTRINQRYRYYIVDEFQDTSFIQYEILKKLINNNFKNVFSVGDEKQAIYGFRGGELGVFLDCEKQVTMPLELSNNYRSEGKIIEFNNSFFTHLFPLADGYKGDDKHSVPVKAQTIPIEEKVGTGAVIELSADAKEAEFNADETETFEAAVIVSKIKKLKEGTGSIAALYMKLKASQKLITELIKNDIGFTAQVKVSYGEDPILGLFYELLKWEFDEAGNSDEIHSFILLGYLNILGGVLTQEELQSRHEKFQKMLNYLPVIHCYRILLSDLGIANSNIENNFKYLESVSLFCHGNKEKLFQVLKRNDSVKYSMDFQYGKESSRIQVMTVHSSKGLQFDHVILGGVYTNGSKITDSNLFGNLPGSFQWARDVNQTKLFKSPHYFFEQALSKVKEFSESKRLFYVANTRAKQTLIWVKINNAKIRNQSNSWINALNSFPELENFTIREKIEVSKSTGSNKKAPETLFHISNMGLNLMPPRLLGISSEQSVTTLALLSQCARKFYLSEVIKLKREDFQRLSIEESKNEQSQPSFSSAERGIEIHALLERIIKEENFNQTNSELIWIVDKLKTYLDNSKLVSEKLIKFDFFGFMLTGVPDLVIYPDDMSNPVEIWDYKTGARQDDKEKSYNFQLLAYSYGLYKLGLIPQNRPIKTLICYVDEKEIVESTTTIEDVEKYLFTHWQKLSRPYEENLGHCSSCGYRNICNK